MTASTINRIDEELLARTADDIALMALLNTKPADDDVPAAVWWLVAEALRTSVELRRAITTGRGAGDGVGTLVMEATVLTRAALAELIDTTDARPTAIADSDGRRSGVARQPGLRLSALLVTRLLVSRRPVGPQRLANALGVHLRAVARCEPPD